MELITKQKTEERKIVSLAPSKNHAEEPYVPENNIRIITATSLFDGHDAAINIMRRIMQNARCEIIHLGHNRSVEEIVNAALQEDVHAIAITSYQGGHIEYFKYMYDLLKKRGAGHIKIFGGGGGVILPEEIKELMDYGITRIYSPNDGRKMGLQGMINDLIRKSDYPLGNELIGPIGAASPKQSLLIGRLISAAENFYDQHKSTFDKITQRVNQCNTPVIGITGTGGSGKSSLVDEIVQRMMADFNDLQVGIVSVDPSKRKTGGALLGDRIRMNSTRNTRVFMRSLATRQSNKTLSVYVKDTIAILKAYKYDLIILETSGIGQSDLEITDHSDIAVYVMTPEYGAATQLEKINMLDFADIVALNKSDKEGAKDALRDIKKQYQRNHKLWDQELDNMPIFDTMASHFNDPGINQLYKKLLDLLSKKTDRSWKSVDSVSNFSTKRVQILPQNRVRYLSEIAEQNRKYKQWAQTQSRVAQKMYALRQTIDTLSPESSSQDKVTLNILQEKYHTLSLKLDPHNKALLDAWEDKKQKYKSSHFTYRVRKKEIQTQTHTESLALTQIPRIALPRYTAWGDVLKWMLFENVPGEFPYTAGIYPFKRQEEDPTRMFAGEGNPERTNYRFHYISAGIPAKRLSTAFDSVTLYGSNPNQTPDVYGKVGNAGVSVCCLDDVKKLYSGFNLIDPKTSVSMTINGPAPMLLAYFLNSAIDQQCELYIQQNGLEAETRQRIKELYQAKEIPIPKYRGILPTSNDGLGLMLLGVSGDKVVPHDVYEKIKAHTLAQVRGTVQADILKEDQAQNTCIFSTAFALHLMGDIQHYFVKNKIRNFYSVSISGYHIAEAGANPITQLAFTLANGFTYVEYYLSRGMSIDSFCTNLSFFFSNGIDPEYAVIGRAARRIWSTAMKYVYQANTRSQKLKYHIQTSGRSLHAQEISFNDIRTTLQALYAIYDNCNSLHTNAYDEAVTTPTEESVRRALAIQMIINKELGLAKNENPLQGSFIIEELTDLVEEAVLIEFDRITERKGVIGAMETMYQRSKIQEESLHYESMKHNGKYPIIGVNTFLSRQKKHTVPKEIIRATTQEKNYQINTLHNLHKFYDEEANAQINAVRESMSTKKNIFSALMEAAKVCSLGQLTNTLFELGGQYRRNM